MIHMIFKETILLFIIYCVYYNNVLVELLFDQTQITFVVSPGLRSIPAAVLPAGQSAEHSHVPQ